MNRLGLCLSHPHTLRIVKDLGEDHDKPVLEWKALAETAEKDGTVSYPHEPLSLPRSPRSSNDSQSESLESEENRTGESDNSSEVKTSSTCTCITSEQDNGEKTFLCMHSHCAMVDQVPSLHYR